MRADALVLFGATGDLARKKLFPALYRLAATGHLGVPVVGVAFSDWDDARLRGYAIEAAEGAEDRVDGTALKKLAGRLAMVSGDYRDPATFAALARRLAEVGAARPVYYLVIPPGLFPVVVQGLARAGPGQAPGWWWRSRSAGTWPQPGNSTGCCTRCSRSGPSSASTTTWARRVQWLRGPRVVTRHG